MNNLHRFEDSLGLLSDNYSHIGWGANHELIMRLGLRSPSLSVAQKIVQTLNSLGTKVLYRDVFPPQK